MKTDDFKVGDMVRVQYDDTRFDGLEGKLIKFDGFYSNVTVQTYWAEDGHEVEVSFFYDSCGGPGLIKLTQDASGDFLPRPYVPTRSADELLVDAPF